RSLHKRLKKLQVLVRRNSPKTITGKTCTMVLVLSFCLIMSPGIYSFWSRGPKVEELKVVSRLIRGVPKQDAARVWGDAAVEFSPECERPSVSGNAKKPEEEEESSSSSLNRSASSDPQGSQGTGSSPSQLQEQLSQAKHLQAAIVWEYKGQKRVQHTKIVIHQRGTDEM
ncbi:CREB3 protein, partial [Centropus unirufus]|nr:CREB3 protein [Centropus unirufus]